MMSNIKYIKFLFMLLLIFPLTIFALDKKEVTLSKCIDGDTARFIIDKEEVKVRFLAIDTPETKHPTKGEEPFGKEASDFTCKKLSNAKKIELEYDENSAKQDKYNRDLAWVFTDGVLLQNELVKNGYASVKYLYGNYKYTDILIKNEEKAKNKKIGIYSIEDTDSEKEVVNEDETSNEIKKLLKKLFANILKEILD